jgi:hypothetical protein
MNKKEIKVGFCVAYDWSFLHYSLPAIYEQADKICISIDRQRKSWTGKSFSFDDERFFRFLHEMDRLKKIQVYEDDFFVPGLSPMENEVRQRNKVAEFLGKDGWHIQLDSDEYFIDFKGFVSYLQRLSPKRKVNICCPFVTLFKQSPGGYFYIKSNSFLPGDFIPIASLDPHYEFGRKNGYFNVKTRYFVVHQSWARSEQEILDKIQNWGHKEDFDVEAYFQTWKELNEQNFLQYKNFHPIVPENWESLDIIPVRSVNELISQLADRPPFTIPAGYLKRENSIWWSRFKALASKL